MEFNTIAISDGITMGTRGHEDRASSPARSSPTRSSSSPAATSSTPSSRSSGCDKTIPGTVMALARLDVPSVMLYGGSIAPGRFHGEDVTIQEVFEAVGAHAAGKITDEELTELEEAAIARRRRLRRPVHRQHDGDGLRDDGHLADGPAMVPAEDEAQGRASPPRPAQLVMDVLARGQRPSDIITRESLENAIAAVADERRLDQRRAAPARRRPRGRRRRSTSTTSTASPRARRCSATSSPAGASSPPTCYAAGGVAASSPSACSRPACCTRTRRPSPADDRRARRAAPARPRARRSCARSTTRSSRPAASRSCAATSPRRAASSSSPGHERRHHSGPARVFEGEEAAMAPSPTGQIDAGRRRRHPQRGPRRRPRHARDARRHRRDRRRGPRRATSRCSPTGASPAPPTASWSATSRPRPSRGGPIAAVRDGDTITIDVDGRRLDVDLSDDEIAERVAAYDAARHRESRTGVLAKYAKLVSSASEGAVTARRRGAGALERRPASTPSTPPRARLAARNSAQQRVEARRALEHRARGRCRSKTTSRERRAISRSNSRASRDGHEQVVARPRRPASGTAISAAGRGAGSRAARRRAGDEARLARRRCAQLERQRGRAAARGSATISRSASAPQAAAGVTTERRRARRARVARRPSTRAQPRAAARGGGTRSTGPAARDEHEPLDPRRRTQIASSAPMKPPIELPTTRGALDAERVAAARRRSRA